MKKDPYTLGNNLIDKALLRCKEESHKPLNKRQLCENWFSRLHSRLTTTTTGESFGPDQNVGVKLHVNSTTLLP